MNYLFAVKLNQTAFHNLAISNCFNLQNFSNFEIIYFPIIEEKWTSSQY